MLMSFGRSVDTRSAVSMSPYKSAASLMTCNHVSQRLRWVSTCARVRSSSFVHDHPQRLEQQCCPHCTAPFPHPSRAVSTETVARPRKLVRMHQDTRIWWQRDVSTSSNQSHGLARARCREVREEERGLRVQYADKAVVLARQRNNQFAR